MKPVFSHEKPRTDAVLVRARTSRKYSTSLRSLARLLRWKLTTSTRSFSKPRWTWHRSRRRWMPPFAKRLSALSYASFPWSSCCVDPAPNGCSGGRSSSSSCRPHSYRPRRPSEHYVLANVRSLCSRTGGAHLRTPIRPARSFITCASSSAGGCPSSRSLSAIGRRTASSGTMRAYISGCARPNRFLSSRAH